MKNLQCVGGLGFYLQRNIEIEISVIDVKNIITNDLYERILMLLST